MSVPEKEISIHGCGVLSTITGVSGVLEGGDFISIRVLDEKGSGSYEQLLKGVDYAISLLKSDKLAGKRLVVNLSVGGAYSTVVNNKVREAYRAGITVVASAGNDGSWVDLY